MWGRLLFSMALLRRVLGRVLAAPLAALVGWIGPEYLPVAPGEFREALTGALVLVVYGIVHKLIDAKVNPQDDASPGGISVGMPPKKRGPRVRPGTRRR